LREATQSCFGLPRELRYLSSEPELTFVRYGDGAVYATGCPEYLLVTEGTTTGASLIGHYVDINDDGTLFVPGEEAPRATPNLDVEGAVGLA
jgi:hypothetical protein